MEQIIQDLQVRARVQRNNGAPLTVSLEELLFLLDYPWFSPNHGASRNRWGNPWGFFRGCVIHVDVGLEPEDIFNAVEGRNENIT